MMKIIKYRPGSLATNTLLGSFGLVIRAIIQAIYLLLLSRWLGAEGYGLFAGSVTLFALGSPLANWGSALLITENIAQDRGRSRSMWATAIVQTTIVGGCFAIGAVTISVFLNEQLPLTSLLLIAVSELLILPITQAASSQCSALESGRAAAISVSLVPLGRTLTISAAILASPVVTPELAAITHFSGTLIGLGAAIIMINWIDGNPDWRGRMPFRKSFHLGKDFAVSNFAGSSYQEVDKVLILQLLGAAALGPYTVAFRIATLFTLPVSALISSSLPRLISNNNVSVQKRTYRFVIFAAVSYGLITTIIILLTAPLLPHIFGQEYTESIIYLELLAFWPILFALRQCLGIGLIANNRKRMRSIADAAALGLAIALNYFYLTSYGAITSIATLIVVEILISCYFYLSGKPKKK